MNKNLEDFISQGTIHYGFLSKLEKNNYLYSSISKRWLLVKNINYPDFSIKVQDLESNEIVDLDINALNMNEYKTHNKEEYKKAKHDLNFNNKIEEEIK